MHRPNSIICVFSTHTHTHTHTRTRTQMFADFQKYHIAQPCLILSNFVGGGAFGDIYQGTVLPHKGASVSIQHLCNRSSLPETTHLRQSVETLATQIPSVVCLR